MKTRKLHNLTVSEVGMDCMAFSHGYGQIPSEQYSIEAIRNGYEHGCTFFDICSLVRSPAALFDGRGNAFLIALRDGLLREHASAPASFFAKSSLTPASVSR